MPENVFEKNFEKNSKSQKMLKHLSKYVRMSVDVVHVLFGAIKHAKWSNRTQSDTSEHICVLFAEKLEKKYFPENKKKTIWISHKKHVRV